MICTARILLLWLPLLVLSGQCVAANFFPTQIRRQAFLRALEKEDQNYDPGERMLRTPYSSPGYHTTLTGGFVHGTRNTLDYAVALLDCGDPDRLPRAEQILRRVIALQDQDPNSRTYGIWSWFLEEPLEKMSPPDWNWADFCGTQLLQVALDHQNRLPADLQRLVQDSILHAARSIQRRNVGPGYTNIALMGTYVTLVAGERFNVPDLLDYGKQRLRRFYEYTKDKGSFTEYNSPTYTMVAIEEISRMMQHVRDAEAQRLLRELNELAWRHVARRFHPPTKQWAGPHSRAYSTLLGPSTLAALQRATGGKVLFLPESEAWESLDAHRVDLKCPSELYSHFTKLEVPREEIEIFEKNPRAEHDIVGTTYLHPQFALGSVNIGDFWNQRHPVIAYWDTPAGPAALRLRCLHDDYDYASASIFTVQNKGDILGAVLFATDRGDTHISLDKIPNATITAKDLRLRLQFEGALRDLKLPAVATAEKMKMREPIRFSCGPTEGVFCIHDAECDGLPVRVETGRDAESAWIDLVLYRGPGREFNFSKIKEAAIVFTLSVVPSTASFGTPTTSVYSSIAADLAAGAGITSPRQVWSWQRTNQSALSLTIPVKPLPTTPQITAAEAKLGPTNPWKLSYRGLQ
jgi:hypothetical protein